MPHESVLLDRLQQLRNSHSQQFEAPLQSLHHQVQQELQRLQQQEAPLVEAQQHTLEALQTALATDARFLLNSSGLAQFLDNLPSSSSRRKPLVAPIQEWLLHHHDRPILITDYQETTNPDDYDDERTFTSIGYAFSLQWGEQTVEVERITRSRLYGFNSQPSQRIDDQIEQVSWSMSEFFPRTSQPSETEESLIQELSHLAVYAVSLLVLQPQAITFVYDSTQEAT